MKTINIDDIQYSDLIRIHSTPDDEDEYMQLRVSRVLKTDTSAELESFNGNTFEVIPEDLILLVERKEK